MINRIRKYLPEILGAFGCLAMGMLIGHCIHGTEKGPWYVGLQHPSFAPPNLVFAPVWTILYLMMGTAFGYIWKKWPHKKNLLLLFYVQFVLNLLWSPLFFLWHRIDLALIDILMLWGVLSIIMIHIRKNSFLVTMFFPYFLWISFATALNTSYLFKNTSFCDNMKESVIKFIHK